MAAQPLNPLDASWLLVESRETPMHVGGLLLFAMPDKAPPDYHQRLMANFRASTRVAPPWNQRLLWPGLTQLRPAWAYEDRIDLEHHVRHSALPAPGSERELGQLIARLHSQPLDLRRPPWECTLIEGLAGGRFALYIKMHHALIDGISAMKLLARSMASDAARSRRLPPFWEIGIRPPARGGRRRAETPAPTVAEIVRSVMSGVKLQLDSVPELARAFGGMLKAVADPGDTLKVPFDTPLSILNGRITGQRRFATQQFELGRLKALAARAGATLNDIVLALCGTALRRFLAELDALPDKPLTAGIPVSVRPKDDENTGNAITFIIATLGTDIDDARARVAAIVASTRRAKAHLAELPRHALMQYTVLLMAPYMLSLLTGIGGRTRPMFNVTISNVPGPEQTLWFRGARLEATYPVSLVSHGQALNITCHGYDGRLAFGFTACRDVLPRMQRLATYTGDALAELEAAFAAPIPTRPRLKRRPSV